MTVRTRDTRPPEPTVRPARTRGAARLAQAAMWPLILGVCGGALAVVAHKWTLAAEILGLGLALTVPLGAAAAAASARRHRFDPWPAVITAGILATPLAWLAFPVLGLGWARIPMLVLALLSLARAIMTARRHRRRTATWRRWAQSLSPVLAQGAGQHEQVLAGLAGTAGAERITSPHFGAAPGAAWTLTIDAWDGTEVAEARLRLPSHDDISGPDFLAKIKDVLLRRVGVHVTLSVDTVADEIRIKAGVEDTEPEEETLEDLAEERVKGAAGMFLKNVKVTAMELVEAAAETVVLDAGYGTAGAGRALQRFTIAYEPTKFTTSAEQRAKFTQHMATQLTGDPDRLRDKWQVDRDQVTFWLRREFPTMIPAPRYTKAELKDMFGDRVVLGYGEDEDGDPAGYALSKTTLPHGGVIGPTGGGKTQLLLLIAMRAAYLGVEVWGADPKRIELLGLRGWPNITRIATRVPDMIQLVQDAYDEMYTRIDDVAAGRIRKQDLKRLLLILDEYFVFCMLVAAWHAANRGKDDPKEHPVFRQIGELLALSRALNINVVLGVQRPDATLFNDGARDNIGWWAALGQLSPQGAYMVWRDSHTGTDLPLDQPGLATVTTVKGPRRAKVHYVPNPADALTGDLSEEDMEILRGMLPEGADWDGPLPESAPDPGFEDSAAAAEATATDPLAGFLFLLQLALQARTAHLTAVPAGGAPANGRDAARYGWGPGPGGGQLEPAGTWIGTVEDTADGRRVYLHPARAYEAAAKYAEELGEPLTLARNDIDAALRNSGLLKTEKGKDGTRYTVRRPLPGNDLGGEARQRVWDIPEDTIVGSSPDDSTAQDEEAAPGTGKQATPVPAPPGPAPAAGPAPRRDRYARAADLAADQRIILRFNDGESATATVFSVDEDQETPVGPDGLPRLQLNYIDDIDGPGFVSGIRADHPIELEQPDDQA